MITEREKKVLSALDALNIEYRRCEHPEADTMEKCERFFASSEAKHCKNLFLTNKHSSVFYLVLLSAEKRFNTSAVSRELGSSRLSFASDEQLNDKLALRHGAVSVAGLINDTERCVRVAIDRALLDNERMLIHPNESTVSLEIKTEDVMRFIRSLGYDITLIDAK